MACPVFIGSSPWGELKEVIGAFRKKGGLFLLADKNTHRHCLPVLGSFLPEIKNVPVLIISGGERSKNMQTLHRLWNWLIENGASRDSLLLNLGGGIVSDIGGFAAATCKRGIAYVNVPTSMIGQADAAIGGKTGINISGIKNQAGVFYDPLAVFIFPGFLKTLPPGQLRSGSAEMIKSAILAGNGFWKQILEEDLLAEKNREAFISLCVNFKSGIVKADPFELSGRKILNFGHTVGHAIEAMSFLPGRKKLLHGEAVAAGMICEAYLSNRRAGLPESDLREISGLVRKYFRLEKIENLDYEMIIRFIRHDKKNALGVTGFSLVSAPGKPVIDVTVNAGLLVDSFEYYNRETRV